MIDLTNRIAEQVNAIFPDYTIYTENQPSGFDVPSFYINRTLTDSVPQLFDVQRRLYGYQIVFFASEENTNEQLEEVSEKLLDNFTNLKEYANISNRELTQDINERTVNFTFDVFIRVWKNSEIPDQERIDLDVRKKDD